MSPLLPWSAQPTYTVELLLGSTAIDSVEPIRSCPSVGEFDQGIATALTTRRPGKLSDGSFSAWKGFGSVDTVSYGTPPELHAVVTRRNFQHEIRAAHARVA